MNIDALNDAIYFQDDVGRIIPDTPTVPSMQAPSYVRETSHSTYHEPIQVINTCIKLASRLHDMSGQICRFPISLT
jgi:hypothetical protein